MRRRIIWLLGGILVLVPAATQADEWDSRDVEAAEGYRETERARASRYRDSLEQRSPRVTRAPGEVRPQPAATPSQRADSDPLWWNGLLRAGVAEEDLRTLSGWIDGLGAWASYWQSEVQPRWQQWRAGREPEPAAPQALARANHEEAQPPFLEALGAKLAHVVLAEVRREMRRE